MCNEQKTSKRISVSTGPIISEEKIMDPRKSEEKAKKRKSEIYSLNVNGKYIAVCSKFFLGTLDYKKDNLISTLFNKQTPMKLRLSASDFPVMWGRHAPIHRMSESTR